MGKKICVFCSSSVNISKSFFSQATEFSHELVRRDLALVYGGGAFGLMGQFANACLEVGGQVYGYIPTCLVDTRELKHPRLTSNVEVSDLMERKRRMMDDSDAFVIFPGGFGTLDEALEVITWKILDQHQKPIVFFSPDDFWKPQLEYFKWLSEQGMISSPHLEAYSVATSLGELWTQLDGL